MTQEVSCHISMANIGGPILEARRTAGLDIEKHGGSVVVRSSL